MKPVFIFDFGGVIVQDTHEVMFGDLFKTYKNQIVDEEEKHNATLQFQELHQTGSKLFNLYKVADEKCLHEIDFWNGILAQHSSFIHTLFYKSNFIKKEDLITPELLSTHLKKNYLISNKKVLEFVRHLKSKNYTIGVLSNHVAEWFDYILKTQFPHPLHEYFDEKLIFMSYHLKLAKPDKKCFDHVQMRVLEYLKSEKEDVQLILIDDKKRNTEAVEKNCMNWKGVVFDFRTMDPECLPELLAPFLQ